VSRFERFLSCHSDAGNVSDLALCPVREKYRVHFWQWSFTFVDGDSGGDVVSVSTVRKILRDIKPRTAKIDLDTGMIMTG